MKGMTKILTLKLKGCWDCPYLDMDWCNNPKGNGFTLTDGEFPVWCPLEDIEDEKDD
jgi:hypothetical protein